MKHYSQAAVERTTKIQEVIMRAMAGKLEWYQATQILGISLSYTWIEKYKLF